MFRKATETQSFFVFKKSPLGFRRIKKQNPPLKKIKDGKKIAMKKKNYH